MRLFEVVVWSAAVAGVWAAAPHRLVPPRPNPFAPRGRGVTPYSVDAPFSAWPQLNDAAFASAVGVSARRRVEIRAGSPLEQLYSNDTLQAKLLAALSRRNAVDRKEYFETFEFFSQVRSGCVSPEAKTLIDVAGGHGLLGALFAVFEARFDSVVIVDTRRPPSYDAVVDALAEVAPWACGKLRYEARDVAETALPRGAAIACVHGCNTLTDVVIDLAVRDHAQSLAVMPCCYKQTARAAPPALSKAFGVDVASDVHRTYDLEARGFDVQWKAIPKAITPMNRILLARRRQTTQENSASCRRRSNPPSGRSPKSRSQRAAAGCGPRRRGFTTGGLAEGPRRVRERAFQTRSDQTHCSLHDTIVRALKEHDPRIHSRGWHASSSQSVGESARQDAVQLL